MYLLPAIYLSKEKISYKLQIVCNTSTAILKNITIISVIVRLVSSINIHININIEEFTLQL